MQRTSLAAAIAVAISTTAAAHPSIKNPSVAANTGGQLITFGISHGCDGSDTTAIKIDIPSTLTSVRPLYSDFGNPVVAKTGNTVNSVTWTKTAPALAADEAFYEIT